MLRLAGRYRTVQATAPNPETVTGHALLKIDCMDEDVLSYLGANHLQAHLHLRAGALVVPGLPTHSAGLGHAHGAL